jgi:hypothetical protein
MQKSDVIPAQMTFATGRFDGLAYMGGKGQADDQPIERNSSLL